MSDLSDDQLCNAIDDLGNIEAQVQARLSAVRRARDELKKERIKRGFEQRAVTDHALVRYLERSKGIDIEAVRSELRQLADDAVAAKDGEHHWHHSGVILVLGQDGRIITVLSGAQLEKWIGRKLNNGTRAVVSLER